MKDKLVYSLYIDIPESDIDEQPSYAWDNVNKSIRTKLQFKKYGDRLKEGHLRYAENIGADYLLFGVDKEYQEFYDWLAKLQPRMSHYDILNFWKLWLFVELAKEYEKVLYLDFDVIPNTTKDFFEVWNVYDSICLADSVQDARINLNLSLLKQQSHDKRNPISKYWNAHAMLTERGMIPDEVRAWNTAIIGGTKDAIEKLHYFDDFENLMEYMKELQDDEFSMYPELIQKSFGFDNETVFGYRVIENNVTVTILNSAWHYKLTGYDDEIPDFAELIHFINKRFDLWWPNENNNS